MHILLLLPACTGVTILSLRGFWEATQILSDMSQTKCNLVRSIICDIADPRERARELRNSMTIAFNLRQLRPKLPIKFQLHCLILAPI